MHALLALALLAAPAPARTAAPRVVVWDLKALQGVSPGAAEILTDLVATEVARPGRFQVMGRNDLASLLGLERQRRLLGCDEACCLAEIGGALGADYVLSGQVGTLGTQHRISLLLLDAKRAVPVARAARFAPATEDGLAQAVPAAVAELLAGLEAGPARELAPSGPALLEQAHRLAGEKRHGEAARAYESYAERFPEGADRCLAAFRAGEEWERAGKPPAAARRFLAVGSDAACAARGPNAAAGALDRAGRLLEGMGAAAEAREAWRRLVELPGVTDAGARAKVEAARMRLELDAPGR